MSTTDLRPEHPGVTPTIVLVHGAFADASSWNGVMEDHAAVRELDGFSSRIAARATRRGGAGSAR